MGSSSGKFVNSQVVPVFCRACNTKHKLLWGKGRGEKKVEPSFLQLKRRGLLLNHFILPRRDIKSLTNICTSKPEIGLFLSEVD